MQAQVTGTHRKTYDALFQHPMAHNLKWRDVRSMLATIGEVVDEENGNVKVSRNGQVLVLHAQRHKDVAEVKELMEIRHFLERSEPAAPPAATGAHLLVVIDHREARIYRSELHGALPQRITPFDPHGFGRYLHHIQDDSNGQRKPERKSFYEAVAQTLRGAEKILLFGSGTGGSSAMDQLLSELKQHHSDIARCVVGSIVVDETHLTEDQLLARARDFYGKTT